MIVLVVNVDFFHYMSADGVFVVERGHQSAATLARQAATASEPLTPSHTAHK